MTLAVILNIVLAIAVVGGIVGLLSWAIISSRADGPAVARKRREPVPNPYRPRPHAPRASRPHPARRRTPVAG